MPLVKRALKVLSEREVSPQLGLLKSTLLQLDSTFSERTYGAGTFRDFVEKLEKLGLVTVKQEGRNLLVELKDGYEEREVPQAPQVPHVPNGEPAEQAAQPSHGRQPQHGQQPPVVADPEKQAEGVAELRRILAAAKATMRWPLYIRQMKQVLKTNAPGFDERTFGFPGLVDLLRAAQKESLVRMERDRQGAVRLFQGQALQAAADAQPSSEQAEAVDGNRVDTRHAPSHEVSDEFDVTVPANVVDTTAQALGHAGGRGARRTPAARKPRVVEVIGSAGDDGVDDAAMESAETQPELPGTEAAAPAKAAKKTSRAAKPKAEKATKAAKPKVERRKTPRKAKA